MESSQFKSEEEKQIITFLQKVNTYREHESKPPIPRNTAVKFLMARKFDFHRAVDLYHSHESGRDSHGAGIALFTARLHFPPDTTHQSVLKALIYILDAALESEETQRYGLVFVYDMSGSKYSNFDYDLSIKILNMLKGAYPARLKKVLIVTAPLWFKAPFKILRLFVREKLRDRVFTVTQSQLLEHIPLDSLPQKFGGNLAVNNSLWLQVCAAIHQSCDPGIIDSYFVSRKRHSTFSGLDSSESDFVHVEGIPDSDDSKESVSEKQTNEEHEKDELIDMNGVEKEVNFEKDDNRGNIKRRREFDNQNAVNSIRKSGDLNDPHSIGQNSSPGTPPPEPCKKRLMPDSSSESIHGPEDGGMTVEALAQHIRSLGKKGLHEEYAEIRREPPAGTFNISKAKHNLPKNRYSDVLCLDHSRFGLPLNDKDPSADYINANYVDGYMQKNAYISTQGPFVKTFGDFWRMVWLSHCVTVVMTTRTQEKGRVKCGQYWPAEEEGEVQCDEFVVTNTGTEQNREYSITALRVQNRQTGEMRNIKHLQFTSWPDYGIPPASGFLEFLLRVRACQADSLKFVEPGWSGHPNGPPIVVHCSAGIGRTGTFINTDISLHRLEHIHTVNIRETVRRIRSQRAFSIQMPDQYVFCHLAIIDYARKHGLLKDADWSSMDSDSDGFE
ncbi:PTN9-like protein [Mya arenaria]|uniref:PTN9-like protein n=1 Tax=Mya arenaria TaxID=6604 RepID=A0ABY7DV09_MYAAR|nr:PTN9-like protein [Mya arenaria]